MGVLRARLSVDRFVEKNALILYGRDYVATFSLPVVVSNLITGESVTLDMMMDTNKLFPSIPASVLRGIGVESRARHVVELVGGNWLTIDQGEVHVVLEGFEKLGVTVLCLFGPEREPPVLGRMVLDLLSLEVDEQHLRLVPVVRRWIEHG